MNPQTDELFCPTEGVLTEWLRGARLREILRLIHQVCVELTGRGTTFTYSIDQARHAVTGDLPSEADRRGPGRRGDLPPTRRAKTGRNRTVKLESDLTEVIGRRRDIVDVERVRVLVIAPPHAADLLSGGASHEADAIESILHCASVSARQAMRRRYRPVPLNPKF